MDKVEKAAKLYSTLLSLKRLCDEKQDELTKLTDSMTGEEHDNFLVLTAEEANA